jgi:triosephosphate isomerase
MRKPVMAGNWKMHKTSSETAEFLREFAPLVTAAQGRCEVVVCAPFVNLPAAVDAARGTNIEIGAQDVFWLKEGAYTGEVSAPMLAAAGCMWVIVGHSERRQYFGETDESVLKKTVAALEAGLKPIVCVGERLEQRETGATKNVLATQFAAGIGGLTPEQFAGIVIAYEPVWAIGTGKTATPEIAGSAHQFLRGLIHRRFGEHAASACRILYGGSVKPDNIQGLMAQEEIDGALVGGASLEAKSFAEIVTAG